MPTIVSEIRMTPHDVVLLTTALRHYIKMLGRQGMAQSKMRGCERTREQMARMLLTHYTDAVSDMIDVEDIDITQQTSPAKGK